MQAIKSVIGNDDVRKITIKITRVIKNFVEFPEVEAGKIRQLVFIFTVQPHGEYSESNSVRVSVFKHTLDQCCLTACFTTFSHLADAY